MDEARRLTTLSHRGEPFTEPGLERLERVNPDAELEKMQIAHISEAYGLEHVPGF
jgi:hypothetical protein